MKKRGLTLIELLLVTTLMAIVLPAVVSVYIYGSKTFYEEFTLARLQSEAQTILDEIALDAKNGLSVESSYDLYVTGSSSIILKVPSIDNEQNILYDGATMKSDTIIYYFTNNTIHKVIFADPESKRYSQDGQVKELAKNILELSFSYEPDPLMATIVNITVKNNETVGKVSRSFSVTTKARLRNHI